MATITTTTNYLTNPAPASTTGFSTTGAAGVWTYNTGEAEPFVRFTKDATGAASGFLWGSVGQINGPIGTVVSFRFWARCSSAVTLQIRNNLTAITGAAPSLSANVWTEVVVTGHAVTVADFRLGALIGTLPGNATLDFKKGVVELGATLSPSFYDGDTLPGTDSSYSPPASLTYGWTGAQDASASVKTLTVPLQDYQIELPDDSITGAGTTVGLLEVNGLRGNGETRSIDYDRAGADGVSPGMSMLGGRTVEIKWLLTAAEAIESALQTLSRNWQNTNDPSTIVMTARDYLMQVAAGGSRLVSALQVQLPGRPLPFLLFGKPGRLAPPVNSGYQFGWLEVSSEWLVPDGKVYDTTVNVASTTLPTSTGGASFPWSFPVNFGPSTGGTLVVDNDGMYPAKPVFRIDGPLVNPKIANAAGQYVRVNLNLMAGDTVVVDSDSRVVRLNGANRNNALDVGSSFFTIPPGGTSLSFSSTDGGDVSGSVSVYTLNTYSAA